MNIKITLILILLPVFKANAQTIPSFSGAEGFGAVTVGGRGGDVYHVTNLNNSGPGSFRAACEASGPRTVVFDVSGIIQLTEEIKITNPYITIAGQTAPGDGIIVAGATVNMTGQVNDILIRYMRFRRSYDKNGPFPAPNTEDAGQCLVGMSVSKNLMMDHISASWGTDENMSMYRCQLEGGSLIPTKNITIQWCIISEALNPAGHAFANTWGGQGSNQHHNLLACNVGRNPSISFSHFMDYRNNVIFNWRDRSMDGAGKEAHLNVINNYYKPGPATGYNWDWSAPLPELKVRIVQPEIRTWDNWEALGLNKKSRYAGPGVIGWWYVNGNVMEGHPEITKDNWEGKSLVDGKYYTGVQWASIVEPYPGIGPELTDTFPEWKGDFMTDHLDEWVRINKPHKHVEFPQNPKDPYDDEFGEIYIIPDLPVIATQTAYEAYQTVLNGAGAIYPVRDAVDARIIATTIDGNPTNGSRQNGIIDHPDEVGGYPVIEEIHRPENWDTDHDGMPDEWEIARKLDPNNKEDRNDDYDNDGYTNLEEYLNDIGAFPAVQAIVWDGELNNRFAQIQNWDISFQPSRFDTAIIKNDSVVVDAIDQHACILKLKNNAILNLYSGCLDVVKYFEIENGCVTYFNNNGSMIVEDVVNNGTIKLIGDADFTIKGSFTNNGIIDISKWNGILPSGIINNGTIIDSLSGTTVFPVVSISSPADNSKFEKNPTITIIADASDGDGTIASVEFIQGSASLGTVTGLPYTIEWKNVPNGEYTISAIVTDDAGAATISKAVNIIVTDFPTINITSPKENDEFYEFAKITINANASDNDGSISVVEFYQGTTLLGIDKTSPYSFTWDSVTAGNYDITAKATDNFGAITTLSIVNISVIDTNATKITKYIKYPDVKVYPNPVNNQLTIEFNTLYNEKININVFDINGKILKSEKAIGLINKMDMSDLNNGLYMIKISANHFNIVKYFLKL